MNKPQASESEQVAQRREKLAALRERGPTYPNDFRRDAFAGDLLERFGDASAEALEQTPHPATIAGRMMSRRVMGKASFAHLQDVSGRIQVYVRRDELAEGEYAEFKRWDLGDIVGASGVLFKTKTGELSLHVSELRLLTKSLRPLPEKFHGLADQETRYRQRYLDLIVNEESRRVFRTRTAVIDCLRNFLKARGFLEVETPMMQVLPGGAAARPFKTHHNALDMDLFLRIAPELYLKRLVVGGFERVFEINRNFRNEGLSTQHNPEFTMLEFYQAYADFNDFMDLSEEMLRETAQELLGTTVVTYQGESYDLAKPFPRMSLANAILHFNSGVAAEDLASLQRARGVADSLGVALEQGCGLGKVLLEIFEKTVEHRLMEPTFITSYPTEVSPLSRRSGTAAIAIGDELLL